MQPSFWAKHGGICMRSLKGRDVVKPVCTDTGCSISCVHTSPPVCPSVSVITKVFTSFAQSVHLFVPYATSTRTSTSAFIYSPCVAFPRSRTSSRLCLIFSITIPVFQLSSSQGFPHLGFAWSVSYQYNCFSSYPPRSYYKILSVFADVSLEPNFQPPGG